MSMVLTVLSLMLPIFLGFVFNMLGVFSEADNAALRKFVVKVSVPFIIFKNLYTSELDTIDQLIPGVLALFVMTGLCTLTASWFAKKVHHDFAMQNAFSFSVIVGNYGYLGWGVMEYFYPTGGLTRAVFFTLLFWPIFLLFGFWLIYLRTKHETADKSVFLKTLVANATLPIVSAGLGLSMNYWQVQIPQVFESFIFTFASFTIPLILFTIGLMFNFRLKREAYCVVFWGTIYRLFFGFLIGIATVVIISVLFHFDTTSKKVILLESVMPPATMVPFFADFIKMDKEVMSGIITMATLVSMVTIPLFYLLIEKLV